jgi:hypothetical protein
MVIDLHNEKLIKCYSIEKMKDEIKREDVYIRHYVTKLNG